MSTTEIREARPEDLNAIAGVFRSHRPNRDWRFASAYFRERFAVQGPCPDDVLLVGVKGDRVIGVIGYWIHEDDMDDVFWLNWFYVHRAEGGQQHGKRLLGRVIEDLGRRGARKLYTYTSSFVFYDRARHRYLEHGFKLEATLPDYYGEGEHQLIYGLSLPARSTRATP